jgi:hypothetical protein
MWKPLRAFGTAVLTPLWFSLRSGHFRSSLKTRAISATGAALPWYTYPSIEFLAARSFEHSSVLEFGAGQSTLWWAARAREVLAFENDLAWVTALAGQVPANVELQFVSREPAECLAAIRERIADRLGTFDVIVIDGLVRGELAEVAIQAMSPRGAIICDNAEAYGIRESFLDSGLMRTDFVGHAPGVIRPHVTSVYFRPSCFLFDQAWPIGAGE